MILSQGAIRDSMVANRQSGKSNGGPLPKISTDVLSIIDDHKFRNVSWLGESEMKIVFTDFCRRYKKYTKSELSTDDTKRLYEEFVLNYESIRLYLKNKKIGNNKDIEKISQFWDNDFIIRYFGQDSFIAEKLGISPAEVRENFGKGVKLRFAINNISDPMEAIKRVKKHLDETLSDENIGKELGISLEEVRENFGKGVKLYFAIYNISDPIKGYKDWKQGKITTPWKYKQ